MFANDRKAPRFSNRKYRKNIITEELYKSWKENTNSELSFKQFKEIWKLIGIEYRNTIINDPNGAKLGASLGDLYVGYIPHTSLEPIDYKASLALGRKVKLQNWNSNGKMGKIIYGTRGRKYIYKLHRYWSFKACTKLRQEVKDALLEFPERFKNSIEKKFTLAQRYNDKRRSNITDTNCPEGSEC